MYTEFLIGYILLGLVLILLVIMLILQCRILKKLANRSIGTSNTNQGSYYSNPNTYAGNRTTAICRNCATQFDATHHVCPKCGTPR